MQEELYLSFNYLKEFRQEAWSRKSPLTRENYRKYGLGVEGWGRSGQERGCGGDRPGTGGAQAGTQATRAGPGAELWG